MSLIIFKLVFNTFIPNTLCVKKNSRKSWVFVTMYLMTFHCQCIWTCLHLIFDAKYFLHPSVSFSIHIIPTSAMFFISGLNKVLLVKLFICMGALF